MRNHPSGRAPRRLTIALALALCSALLLSSAAVSAAATTPAVGPGIPISGPGAVGQKAIGGPISGPIRPTQPTPVKPPGKPIFENPDPARSILVLGVGWGTFNDFNGSPVNEFTVPMHVSYLREQVNDWFAKAAPGMVPRWSVVQGGSFEIATPRLPAIPTEKCTGQQDREFFDDVIQRTDAAAKAKGIDPSPYDVVAYVWAADGLCGHNGLTNTTGGDKIGLSRTESAPIHELGHHFGLNHANGLRCTNAAGTPVPLSTTCTEVEYGDPYDVMGQGSGLFNAIHANALGWLNGQVVNATASSSTQSFTLKPYSEIPAQGPRAIRLVDGSTTLWLEYRQPTGLDRPGFLGNILAGTPGLIIRRQGSDPHSGGPTSQLIDMTPTTPVAQNANLPVGQSWSNPLGTTKITLSSAGATGATVTISSQLVTVPRLQGMTITGAVNAIRAAGLTSGGFSGAPDPVCNSINLVMSQTPAAGAQVQPGSSVRFVVGEKPKTPCF
jgi:PASTA domain